MLGVDEMKYLREYKAAYFCSGVSVTQSRYGPRTCETRFRYADDWRKLEISRDVSIIVCPLIPWHRVLALVAVCTGRANWRLITAIRTKRLSAPEVSNV
jgi:hypothetical protein